jgi:hypothetical protein
MISVAFSWRAVLSGPLTQRRRDAIKAQRGRGGA